MSDPCVREIRLSVDSSVYSMEAVQAAAYAFTDRSHVRIASAKTGAEMTVVLRPKPGADAAVLEGDFFNELLHQVLRLRVSSANAKIREYIVTRALVSAQPPSEAPCAECEGQTAAPAPAPVVDKELEAEIDKLLAAIEKDGEPDPLRVAVPWEEKFGQDGAKAQEDKSDRD